MHRWRIVAAGTLVSAMTVLAYQVVSGVPSGAGAQSSFCTTGQRLQSEIQDLENVDIETLSIANFRSRYRRFADLIKQLDKQAPPELENAFKRLRRFYGKVADGKIDLDITSVESMRRRRPERPANRQTISSIAMRPDVSFRTVHEPRTHVRTRYSGIKSVHQS